jgi:stage III sporulation protein SpoIIIAA
MIVRNMSPDRVFIAQQRSRLEELMALRREAIAGNSSLTAQEGAELEQLVDAEVLAATERAAALSLDMAR